MSHPDGKLRDTEQIVIALGAFGATILILSGGEALFLPSRGDAFRLVYALQIDTDIWVIHAFQKKSKSGIKTPKQETGLVHERLRRLRERLQ
jgi:MoaA/NifB/PqqE/SkfB family radical SAM enzyme